MTCFFLACGFGLISCSVKETPLMSSTPTLGQLTLYASKTIKPTKQPRITEEISPPKTPIPTPTALSYKVVEGDTLTSIAFQHGIKLADLMAANPGIDPNFLTIGITITLPNTVSNTTSSLLPTPISIEMSQPICYGDSVGGQWCLAHVNNTQPFDVENISAKFYFLDSNQEITRVQLAISPLNVLPAGEAMPVAAYFPPPTPNSFHAKAEIETITPIPPNDDRYLQPILDGVEISLSDDKLQAAISGNVSISENQSPKLIWILAVAFDKEKRPIGYRKWVAENNLQENDGHPFQIHVFSLGPPIDMVELMVEARP